MPQPYCLPFFAVITRKCPAQPPGVGSAIMFVFVGRQMVEYGTQVPVVKFTFQSTLWQ